VRRRAFITLLGGAAAAWPLAARAQQSERVRRIGVIMNYAENDPEGQIRLSALRDAFRKLGWTEGNSRIDYCWTAGNIERGQACATQLLSLPADAIIVGSTPLLAQLSRLTRSVPVVFVQVADPVGSGFVANYAQPGGILPALPILRRRSPVNGSSSSSKQRLLSIGWRFCSIRSRVTTPSIGASSSPRRRRSKSRWPQRECAMGQK
jgi:hypothetical protein